MSNSNYAPKARVVENNFCGRLGYGTWSSCTDTVVDGLKWCTAPEDLCLTAGGSGRSTKLRIGDPVLAGADLRCASSSELTCFSDTSIDLVITDPPFGDNIFYSDLANFFHVWLRLLAYSDDQDDRINSRLPGVLRSSQSTRPRILRRTENSVRALTAANLHGSHPPEHPRAFPETHEVALAAASKRRFKEAAARQVIVG
jgi:hypothetical protein